MAWTLSDDVENEALLKAVGLTPAEIRLYRALLERHPQGLEEVAASTEATRVAAERAVHSLEAKGLVTRSPGHADSFLPVSPSLGLEALVLRREQELGQVRTLAQRFEDEYLRQSSRVASAQMVEVLDTPEIVGQRALQLLRAARQEFLSFDKPPYTTSAEENDPAIDDVLDRGVRVRAIYDRESLVSPEGLGLTAVRRFLSGGEEGRVFPNLPFKMNIADRKTALLPLVFEESGSIGGALVVHSEHLVQALASLWDILWEQALPIPLEASVAEESETRLPKLVREESELIDLLLAGAKSDTIAHQLDLGVSTVERRIRKLIRLLGAETRFQAGFQLGRHLESSSQE